MTVVLINPRRPGLIPISASAALAGTVLVTEDVPVAVLWLLGDFEPAVEGSDPSRTLLAADPDHRFVRERIARGDRVITTPPSAGEDLLDAVALMNTLRRNGLWESAQTHASLRRYLLEEVYELLDAIDTANRSDLREELGDLLLQLLFHASIAADHPDDPFDIDAVARSFIEKMRRRAPGVLSGTQLDVQAQIREWEERKAAEKLRGSVLDGIATTAPALALTQKVLERLTASDYPVDTIDPAVWTVTVAAGEESVEAAARARTLDVMRTVRAAEAYAAASGTALDSRDAWLAVLNRIGARF
ncbi:MAG: MazG family protein [Gordonia sp. (in: high G+C Gram-positive bacteria)]